jgi:hypothetical protein
METESQCSSHHKASTLQEDSVCLLLLLPLFTIIVARPLSDMSLSSMMLICW